MRWVGSRAVGERTPVGGESFAGSGKLRIEITGIGDLTSVQDEGTRELLEEGGLRKAKLSLNTVETIDQRGRVAV